MSWIKNAIIPTAVFAALVAGSAAHAGSIVVRSSDTKLWPTGKVLADNAKISLKAGQSVTILDGKGTRVLNGPGTFSTVVGGGTAQEARVKNILGNSGTRVARTGAIRGTDTKAKPTSIWQADISRGGTICVANSAGFSAWRPLAATQGTYTATRLSDGKSAPLIFAAARPQTLWPTTDLPVKNGDTFRISGGDLSSPVDVRFAVMDAQPTGLETTISEMMGRGCTAQYELLIDMVNVIDEPATPAG